MKTAFYKSNIIYCLTIIFLFGCDSTSTSSLTNNDNNGNNNSGGSNNTDLPAGFSSFISEEGMSLGHPIRLEGNTIFQVKDN